MKAVSFTPREVAVIVQCLKEVGGGSAAAFNAVAGHPPGRTRTLLALFRDLTDGPVELPESGWRDVYNAVHAAVYALGPEELHTCTGYTLAEVADVQQKLCGVVWGAFHGTATFQSD